jgi:hypothetical protein
MMRSLVLVVSAVVASAAAAQGAQRADPRDPKAPAPAVPYYSAFEGYRPYAEQELVPWRKANEEVGAAGGHVGLHKSRQGSGEKAPAGAPAASDAKPPADGAHGDHK